MSLSDLQAPADCSSAQRRPQHRGPHCLQPADRRQGRPGIVPCSQHVVDRASARGHFPARPQRDCWTAIRGEVERPHCRGRSDGHPPAGHHRGVEGVNRRRAQCRRTQREADRKCLTAADVQRLNAARRLPDDYPPIARVLRDGLELSDAQMAQLRSDVEEVSYEHAQAVLSCVNASAEFKAWKRELTSHPGPVSILPPDIAMTAVIAAERGNVSMAVIAAERGNAWRSEVCRVVNGDGHPASGTPRGCATTRRESPSRSTSSPVKSHGWKLLHRGRCHTPQNP